jgi:hypothetical protein
LRQSPIFDTNVFGDIQRGKIPQADWRYILRRRPSRGWPLSNITALELLVGVDATPPQNFLDVRDRIALAYDLSKGRILDDPRLLLCKELLRVPFPPNLLPPAADVVSRYIDLVRRANSLDELLSRGVLYKLWRRRRGFNMTAVLSDLMAGPKKQWVKEVEAMATEKHPEWRQLFQRTDKRLPPKMRKEVESQIYSLAQRTAFVEGLLVWLGVSTPPPETVAEITRRLDAVLEFTIFVAREFLLRDYSPEKHESDVYDQFQLQYLALDRFVIVSGDSDLSKRTAHSTQADRIMSFQKFLQSL